MPDHSVSQGTTLSQLATNPRPSETEHTKDESFYIALPSVTLSGRRENKASAYSQP